MASAAGGSRRQVLDLKFQLEWREGRGGNHDPASGTGPAGIIFPPQDNLIFRIRIQVGDGDVGRLGSGFSAVDGQKVRRSVYVWYFGPRHYSIQVE